MTKVKRLRAAVAYDETVDLMMSQLEVAMGINRSEVLRRAVKVLYVAHYVSRGLSLRDAEQLCQEAEREAQK